MDAATMTPLVFRGSERLLIVIAATVCIILGYKLFKIIPTQRNSEGKFTLGDLSVTLTRVGPGVFFSLFGAFVLYQSVSNALSMGPNTAAHATDSSGTVPRGLRWMGATQSPDGIWADRAVAHIMILNCLARTAPGTKVQRDRIEEAIHIAKLAIIADVWAPAWGDESEFARVKAGSVKQGTPVGELYHARREDC